MRSQFTFTASRPSSSISLTLLSLLLIIMITASITWAQSITDATTPTGLAPGTPAGSYALSGMDNVNLFSGNMNFTVTLLKVGGRGEAQSSIVLPIETHWKNLYFFRHPAGWYYNPFPMYNMDLVTGLRPGYGPGVLVLRGARMDLTPCAAPWAGNVTMSQTRLTFISPDGTEFELRDTLHDGAPIQWGCAVGPPVRGTTFVTNDGTSTTFISDTLIDESYVSSRELNGFLMMRDGIRYRIDRGLVSWMRDQNGNQITYTYTNDRITSIKDSLDREITFEYQQNDVAPYGLCDRIKYKGSGGVERIIRISYSALSATFASGFAPLSKNQMFPPAIADWVNDTPGMTTPFETNVISSIWLPDGRRYRFLYNSFAEVARAELPTGGAYEYDWETTPNAGYEDPYPQEILRRVKERRVFNGVGLEERTAYSYSIPGTRTGNTVVTVDRFDGSQPGNALAQEKHFFFGTPIPPSYTYQTLLFTDSPWNHGREFQIDLLSPNGAALLRRTTNTWRQRTSVTWCTGLPSSPCNQDTAPAKDPRIVENTITLGDTNQVSKKTSIDPNDPSGQTVGFDQYNNQTDIWEYDFGAGQPGAFLRRTHFTYVTTPNYINANVDPAFGAHLRELQSEYWISSDIAGNAKQSLTVFEYDNYADDARHKPLVPRTSITGHGSTYSDTFTVRGNLTGTTSYINAGSQTGPVTQSGQYDIAGNVVANIDGVGNLTTKTFLDSFCNGSTCGGTFTPNTFAFVNATTSPIPDPLGQNGSTTGLTTTTVYDYFTGNVASTTDPNGQTTSYQYVDTLDRLTAIIRPAGAARTDLEYGDTVGNLFLRSVSDLDAGRRTEARELFDGLGRLVETRMYENSTQYIAVKHVPFTILQDPDSTVMLAASQVSNPFRPPTEQPVWTTSFVDALTRITKIRTPDDSIVRTTYSGNTTTITDQANRKRQTVTDALGRLRKVYEDPTGSNLLTSYDYNVLDNVTSSTQQDPVTQYTQTRTFAYDSLKRLTSASNPENGTVAYQYDNNNNILVRTDARNVSTHYKYDALNRPTRRWYNASSAIGSTLHNNPAVSSNVGATDEAKLYYDSVTVPGAPAFERGAASGRLVAQIHGAGNTGDYYGYDSLGRPNLKIQQIGAITYQLERTYNAAGLLTSQKYPSQRTVNYNYDNAGRLGDKDVNNLAFTGNLGDNALRTYARGVTYDSLGMTQEQFGTTTALYTKLLYNTRQQVAEILLSTTANDDLWDRGKIINDYSAQCSGASCNGTDNNGNLMKQQILIPGLANQRQQQYEYDSFNRIQWVRETKGGVEQWRQWYKYDRWGNRTIDNTIESGQSRTYGPGINNLNFEVEKETNRLLATGDSALSADNRKMRYDAAGNLVNDSWTSYGSSTAGEYTRKYDGENKMVSAKDDSGGTSVYTYDASGQRTRRAKGSVETWQVYGFDGELVAEYAANGNALSPQREYGYRNRQLLITTETGSLSAAPPTGLAATPPTSGSNITLSWSQASGATSYRVERKVAGQNFTLKGTTSSLSMIDSTTSAGNAYLYRVCAADGAGNCTSAFSNIALGAAITFSDPTIVSIVDDPSGATVTPVRATHINELRAAVIAVRNLAGGLPPVTWTYQNASGQLAPGDLIHVQDVRELRTYLDPALSALGIDMTPYTDPTLTGYLENPSNATPVRAVHIRELRQRVRSGIGAAGGGGGPSFKIYWLVTDQLGTPRMLVDVTGTVAKRHDYLPFGEELFAGTGGRLATEGYGCPAGQQGCTSDNVRQQFSQKERDAETGLDYFGARYYGSTQGRFTSPDPLSFWALDDKKEPEYLANPQRLNKYIYALNNPLRYIDPTGLVDMPLWDDLDRRLRRDLERHGVTKKMWNKWSNEQRQGLINFRAKMIALKLWDKVASVQYGVGNSDGKKTTWTVDRKNPQSNWQLGFTVKGNVDKFREALTKAGIPDDGEMHKHKEAKWSAHEGSGMSIHILGLKAPATRMLTIHWDTGGGNWYDPRHWGDVLRNTGPNADAVTAGISGDAKVEKNLRVGSAMDKLVTNSKGSWWPF